MQTTCPACHGQGQVIRDACRDCGGSAYVQELVTRKVDIPAGVDEHTRLRLNEEGEPSPDGGPSGDCYCFIHVNEHALFQRKGQDLFCAAPITYTQAALGATIEVPTLDGREELRIPPARKAAQPSPSRGVVCPTRDDRAAAACWCRCRSTSRIR